MVNLTNEEHQYLCDMAKRAEAAEARAAQLEQDRDNAIAERDRANAGFAAMNKAYNEAMTRLSKYEKVTA